MDASAKAKNVEAGRKLLEKYKKKKGKPKKKKLDVTAENGSDMDSIVLRDTTNMSLGDDQLMGGVAPEDEISKVPMETAAGLESVGVTQSLPSPVVGKQHPESIMLTSLPVGATHNNDDDGHLKLGLLNPASEEFAGNMEAKEHYSDVTSFVEPGNQYNSQDALNSVLAHNTDTQDHSLDDWEAAVPGSLPHKPSSINNEVVPSGSVEDHSAVGQDLHFLSSRNQELQAVSTQLGREIKELREEKIELLNELESVREKCFADVERARREVAANYEHQVVAGQQALVESERRLQDVEAQLEEARRTCKQLEDRHAQDLLDRDQNHARNILSLEQKHLEEVNQVREESRSQPMIRDADEQAAEWMKIIKDQMRKNYEAEKQVLIEKHLEELKMNRDDFQKKMDLQQQQLQTAVNEQLAAYYQQWVASSRGLEEQNKTLRAELERTKADVEERSIELESKRMEIEHLVASLRSKEMVSEDQKEALTSLKAKCAEIAREKEALEGECRTLHEEVKRLEESSQLKKHDESLIQGDDSQSSDVLERSFKEWNEAASKLDEKLSSPKKHDEDRVLEAHNQEEVKALRSLVGEYEVKMMESETRHRQELAQLKEKLAFLDTQREEERVARTRLEGEVESLRLLGEEYENQLREMKAKQQQELSQVQADAEGRLSEALRNSQEEYDKKVGELCANYESEIEKLKEASAAAVSEHRQELQQLEEELSSMELQKTEEKMASEQYKEELESLRLLCEEQREKLSAMKAAHAEEVLQLQSDADERLKGRVSEICQQNKRESDLVIARYEAEIERLREANAAAMNESMDRASLEVAEEHMKSLREQLNGYRNQEQSYESRLTEMEKNHSDAVARILKQCEDDKNTTVSQIEKQANAKIKMLEGNVLALAKEKELVEVQFTARLKEAHQKDMEVLEATIKAKMEEKLELERSISNKAEREREKLEGDIAELKVVHGLQVAELNDTISQAEHVFSEKFSGKTASLQEHISKLENTCEESELAKRDLAFELAALQQQKQDIEKDLSRIEIERNQLSEDCDRYQKRAKMLEVEASISKSAEENMQKVVEEKTALLEEKQAALDTKIELAAHLTSTAEELNNRVTELEKKTLALEAEKSRVVESLATKGEEFSLCKAEYEKQLEERQGELAASELKAKMCSDNLAAKEEELQSSRESFKSTSEQLALVKQELGTQNTEYQTIIDQLAAKNQSFVDLQVENDSLKSSLDSLGKRYQEEVDAREELRRHLEGRWGESEEIEQLKQQVAELGQYKDRYRDIMLKMESLGEEVSSKEKLLAEASQSLLLASQHNQHYEEENANYAKVVASLQQDLLQAEEARTELQQQVQSVEAVLTERSETIKEMERLIEELERKVEQSERNAQIVVEEARQEASQVEEKVKDVGSKLKRALSKEMLMLSELQEKEEAIQDLSAKLAEITQSSETQALKVSRQKEELSELASKLDVASRTEETLRSQLLDKDGEILRLNKFTNSDMESSSAVKEMANEIDSLRATLSSLELEVANKNAVIEELNQAVEVLKVKLSVADEAVAKLEAEKSQMQRDLLQCQNTSTRSTDGAETWPEKYSELEKVVSTLKEDKETLEAQLADLQSRTAQMEALEARIKDQDKTIKDLRATSAGGGGITTPLSSPNYKAQLGQDLLKNPLGATLTRARKTLAERLQERDTIEKELRFRRAKLERQLAEKQCLEHLLFEKKRFELELQNQKSLLKKELEELELKNVMREKPIVK